MDYAAEFTRHDEYWVLTFPDVPQYWAVASNCNDLLEVATFELGVALCTFYEESARLPSPTPGGHIRLAPDWFLMKKFILVDELWRRLQVHGDQVWRTMGLDDYITPELVLSSPRDLFEVVLEWPEEEIPKSFSELGLYVEPPPPRTFAPLRFTSGRFSPAEVRERLGSLQRKS